MIYSTHLKQSATNQLSFPLNFDPESYGLLTFGFYQDGRCVAKYTSADTDYVDLTNNGEVRIYMTGSVSKRFGPQRVSFEITAWEDDHSLLLIEMPLTVDICRSNERNSIVDVDDTEITDERVLAQLERLAYKYIPSNVNQITDYLQQQITALEARVAALEDNS